MNRKIRIAGLTLGDPFSRSSRSGVNFNIFSRLRNSEKCELVDVFDLDLGGFNKLYSAVANFSINRARWGSKLHQNPWAFNARTKLAEHKLNTMSSEVDIIYQDGAMFMPGYNTNIPLVSYHDSNVLLSARGGVFAHGAHYKGKALKKTIAQEKMLYEKAELVFTMSDWLKRSLIEDFGIGEDKIRTVYAGTNQRITNVDKTYDGKTILFVGRDFKRKGGMVLLEAFKKVSREIKDARLVIVGSNPKVDIAGVDIKGQINDKELLESLYKQASIFVLPSLFEPFGIVFAEAFAYKLPSIGSDTCAMPEIIEDGKGGFVVPPGDIDSLANKIIILLKDEKLSKQMGEYGYRKVKELFNWDIVVNKMISQLEKIV